MTATYATSTLLEVRPVCRQGWVSKCTTAALFLFPLLTPLAHKWRMTLFHGAKWWDEDGMGQHPSPVHYDRSYKNYMCQVDNEGPVIIYKGWNNYCTAYAQKMPKVLHGSFKEASQMTLIFLDHSHATSCSKLATCMWPGMFYYPNEA